MAVTRRPDVLYYTAMAIEVSSRWQVVPAKDQVSCDLGEESVVLHCVKGIYYGLNPVAATIWREVKQSPTVAELREAILREYEVPEAQCEADLLRILDEMKSAGLVEFKQVA